MQPTISPEALNAWTDIIINHSIGGVEPGQVIMIRGEYGCWDLMSALQDRVLEAGGIPDIYLCPPDLERSRVWSGTAARILPLETLEETPEYMIKRWERADKYIEVLGSEDPSLYAGLPAERTAAIMTAYKRLSDILKVKPWTLTLFPTQGFADMEGMDLQEYSDFLVSAATMDPNILVEPQKTLKPLFDEASQVTIVTEHPDGRELTLTMSIAQGKGYMCTGEKNWIDGEIFTSPDANTVEGEIFVDLPVHFSGTDIQGIYLRFVDGKIVEYKADQGMDELTSIIETDEGSHRLGEIALGMNPHIKRVLKHPLFVEKVGGTLHIAIGESYTYSFVGDDESAEAKARIKQLKDEGVYNDSKQHVDVVIDFRPGGCGKRVFFDQQEIVVRDGIWVPA